MTLKYENRIQVKIFIGCYVNSEIRMYLNESKEWKQNTILKDQKEGSLIEVHFQNKDYIGYYLPSDCIKLSEIKGIETNIKSLLKRFLPENFVNFPKIYVFSQLFVA